MASFDFVTGYEKRGITREATPLLTSRPAGAVFERCFNVYSFVPAYSSRCASVTFGIIEHISDRLYSWEKNVPVHNGSQSTRGGNDNY